MNTIHTPEHIHTINGVSGRMHNRVIDDTTGIFRNQKFNSVSRPIRGYGKGAEIKVSIRFDDECKNGHQTFAITAEVQIPGRRDIEAGGCMHEEIAKVFPEFAPLIKWHLVSTDGPMHYVGNTCYYAGNRDHNGLLKGEKRQIKNGRTGLPAWQLVAIIDGEERPVYEAEKYIESLTEPVAPVVKYAPCCTVGEGKERDFNAARNTAVWPEATNEQLSVDRPELEAILLARLPGLIADFRADMDSCGFLWGTTY